MKRFIYIFIVVLFATNAVSAKVPFRKEATWMGLDFTEVKLLTSSNFTDPLVIRNSYMQKWNDIVLNESSKFNISKYFRIEKVHYDLSVVRKRNLEIPLENLVVDDTNIQFNEDNVKSIILQYPKSEGVGLVLIVESLNKITATGTFWATYFDRSTLEVLSTKRIEGRATGIGLRNFWANSVYNAIKYNN